MMGALAWQATAIKKDILVSRGADRTGVDSFLAPGSPPPWCPCPRCFVFSAAPLRYGTRASPLQKSGAPAIPQGTIGNLVCNFLYVHFICSSQRLYYVISRISV